VLGFAVSSINRSKSLNDIPANLISLPHVLRKYVDGLSMEGSVPQVCCRVSNLELISFIQGLGLSLPPATNDLKDCAGDSLFKGIPPVYGVLLPGLYVRYPDGR